MIPNTQRLFWEQAFLVALGTCSSLVGVMHVAHAANVADAALAAWIEKWGKMPRITELFCFAVYDGGPDDEGVPAFTHPFLGTMPLMGADNARIEALMPMAQQLADTAGKELRIYKFSHKEQIGVITPRSK